MIRRTRLASVLILGGLALAPDRLSAELYTSHQVSAGFHVRAGEVVPRRRALSLVITEPRMLDRRFDYRICSTLRWRDRYSRNREIDVRMKPRLIRDGRVIKLRRRETFVEFDRHLRSHLECLEPENRLRTGDTLHWTFRLRQRAAETDDTLVGIGGFVANIPRSGAPAPPKRAERGSFSPQSGWVNVDFFAAGSREKIPRRQTITWVTADDTILRDDDRYELCTDAHQGRFGFGPTYKVVVDRISADGVTRVGGFRRRGEARCKVVEMPLAVGDLLQWTFEFDQRRELEPDVENRDASVFGWLEDPDCDASWVFGCLR